jgi:hypothetical protein
MAPPRGYLLCVETTVKTLRGTEHLYAEHPAVVAAQERESSVGGTVSAEASPAIAVLSLDALLVADLLSKRKPTSSASRRNWRAEEIALTLEMTIERAAAALGELFRARLANVCHYFPDPANDTRQLLWELQAYLLIGPHPSRDALDSRLEARLSGDVGALRPRNRLSPLAATTRTERLAA